MSQVPTIRRISASGHTNGVPAEWLALLAAVRTQLTTCDALELRQALGQRLEWDQLLSMASHHDVAALILRALERLDPPAPVPASVLTALRRVAAAHAMRNTLLFRELACLLSHAHSRRIDVVVMKGAALAEAVYGDRALRPMGDLDLLVRTEHLPELGGFLIGRGYRLMDAWPWTREWWARHHYHFAYTRRSEGLPSVTVELHWQLDLPSRPFDVDLDGMWSRAVPARIAHTEAKSLSPEDALLHVCVHACRHGLTAGLRPYCDIAAMLRVWAGRLDWELIDRLASAWRIGSFVYVPLALTRELLHAEIADSCLDALAPTAADRDVVRAAARVLAERPVEASLFRDFADLRWRASRSRLEVLRKVLSRDVVAARYGLPRASPRIWLQYPRRLAYVCRSYGPELWRFVRGRERALSRADDRSRLERFLRPFQPARPRPTKDTPGAAAPHGTAMGSPRRLT